MRKPILRVPRVDCRGRYGRGLVGCYGDEAGRLGDLVDLWRGRMGRSQGLDQCDGKRRNCGAVADVDSLGCPSGGGRLRYGHGDKLYRW